ncbi:hypothetical protein [Halohasta salina]|uniref:hypothetical protein n=1 Tax=Halohasta salina TaxID=2961621 RepID=UPI0020A3D868|nr:hypothetical protein [Halohasta salina]
MVQDRLRDGTRIAQLVASELTGDRRRLAQVAVVDADPDVEPTADGVLAYRIVHVADPAAITVGDRGGTSVDEGADRTTLAEVFVQPERARVEFVAGPDAAAKTAADAELRVRPKAVDPPRTLVFVEDGAAAKRVIPIFEAVVAATEPAAD